MRKILCIMLLAPVLLLLSCNLQMPTAVQIKGSPDLRFAAQFDIGEYLADFLDKDQFEQDATNIELLDCINTPIVTYLVYMEVFNESISLDSITNDSGFTNGFNFTAPNNIELKNGNFSVPDMDFGEYLKGFTFDQGSIKSKLYISGSPIVSGLSVDLTIDSGTTVVGKGTNESGLKNITDTYTGTELPDGGIEITLPFSGNQFNISYKIYVKAGQQINSEWVSGTGDKNVFVELAVLLPFKLTANQADAEVKLPDNLFSKDNDLFGRESPSSDNTITDMLESISLAMKMNTNPFTGAKLSVKSKGINIENQIKGNSLEFAIDEKNMKAINTPANIPFTPQFKLVFDNGGTLSFPRKFFITEISFKAKLNHTIDLSGGIN